MTVTNTGTQQKRTATSTDRGDFEITALDVGFYDLQAELPGFRVAVIKGIQVEVDQRARADVQLQLGEVTQRVEVEGNPVTVQTDDSTLSTVMDAAKIRELPLPGNRNLFRLALLAPGMSRGPASSVTTSGFGPGFGIAAMGQKVHNNAILLDGASLRTSIHGAVRMRPSVEAIQEFKVESGWYSAEYGTQSGAQIIATMRAGTNAFHGVLFHFLRNDKLDARNFFENPNTPKTPLRRNTFGGVLSGPILRNRTFLHVQWRVFQGAPKPPNICNLSDPTMREWRPDRIVFPSGGRIGDSDHGSVERRAFSQQSDSGQPDRVAVASPHAILADSEHRPERIQRH